MRFDMFTSEDRPLPLTVFIIRGESYSSCWRRPVVGRAVKVPGRCGRLNNRCSKIETSPTWSMYSFVTRPALHLSMSLTLDFSSKNEMHCISISDGKSVYSLTCIDCRSFRMFSATETDNCHISRTERN